MRKQTAIFFYVLSAYVVLQFLWWGFHLIQLSNELADPIEQSNRRILMIVGEGSVFLLILIFGLWKIRKSIQKELALSQRQNNFLLSVTHELKTPLASNKLYLQTLMKHPQLDFNKKQELLENAVQENKRLETMIENILTAAQLENASISIEKEEVNVSEIVQEIVQNWSKERVEVKLNIQADIYFQIDVLILETCLYNLLDNAFKYSLNEPKIVVQLEKSKGGLRLSVQDEGIGVKEKDRAEIFKKFVRVGNEEIRSQKGSGLGLFIVKELLKIHNAEIKCIPNNPTGSNFVIKFSHE